MLIQMRHKRGPSPFRKMLEKEKIHFTKSMRVSLAQKRSYFRGQSKTHCKSSQDLMQLICNRGCFHTVSTDFQRCKQQCQLV